MERYIPLPAAVVAGLEADADRRTQLALAAREIPKTTESPPSSVLAAALASAAPESDRAARIARLQADWAASPELRREHPTAGSYAAFQHAFENGHVRIFDPAAAARGRSGNSSINLAMIPDEARAAWKADPALQAKFPRVETFIAYREAVAQGRVRIFGAAA